MLAGNNVAKDIAHSEQLNLGALCKLFSDTLSSVLSLEQIRYSEVLRNLGTIPSFPRESLSKGARKDAMLNLTPSLQRREDKFVPNASHADDMDTQHMLTQRTLYEVGPLDLTCCILGYALRATEFAQVCRQTSQGN